MGSYFKYIGIGIILAYIVLNYYIGLRSFQAIKAFFPAFRPVIFWPLFIIIASSFILDRLLPFSIPVISQIGIYWVAIFFYLLMFYLLIDLVGLIHSFFEFLPANTNQFWHSQKIYASAILLTLVVLIGGTINAYSPQTVKYDLQIAKDAGDLTGIKVVMISDLHFSASAYTKYMETAAETITSMNPDMIFLVGDIFEGTIDPITREKMDRMLDKLEAKHGIYAVLGNHEYYGNQVQEITNYLKSKDIILLIDEISEVMDASLYIVGRNDYRAGGFNTDSTRKTLAEIMQNIDSSKPIILLDHQPQQFDEAQKNGVDLMVSGHTHGGQLFPAQVVTKRMYVIDRGLWQDGSFHLIVTTGLGIWGPPVRTSSRSEIVEINITFVSK